MLYLLEILNIITSGSQTNASKYNDGTELTANGWVQSVHELHTLFNKTTTVSCVRKSLIHLVNQSSLNRRQIQGPFAAPPSRHHNEQTSGAKRERGEGTNTSSKTRHKPNLDTHCFGHVGTEQHTSSSARYLFPEEPYLTHTFPKFNLLLIPSCMHSGRFLSANTGVLTDFSSAHFLRPPNINTCTHWNQIFRTCTR